MSAQSILNTQKSSSLALAQQSLIIKTEDDLSKTTRQVRATVTIEVEGMSSRAYQVELKLSEDRDVIGQVRGKEINFKEPGKGLHHAVLSHVLAEHFDKPAIRKHCRKVLADTLECADCEKQNRAVIAALQALIPSRFSRQGKT